jgi:hypothetical protein
LSGFKHLIQCHCILPQFRKLDNPIFHRFVVFSNVDDSEDVIPKIVKCNNCEVAHKVTDFCKSEMLLDGEDVCVISISDIRQSLSDKLCQILDDHKCDIATWEQTKDIIENQSWGSIITLSSKKLSGMTNIKSIIINDEDDFKIEANMRQDDIVRR